MASDTVFAVLGIYSQGFFMGILFLLAGYFIVPSYGRKGPSRFLRDRVIRLLLPTLLFMFVIAPPVIHYTYAPPGSFTDTLAWHLPNPNNWDSGPMWFTLALLLFTVFWMAFDRMRGPLRPKEKTAIGHWHLVALALLMGLGSFGSGSPLALTS